MLYQLLQHEIKQYKLNFILSFYLKIHPPPRIPTHHVPFSTRSYTCGTWSLCLDLCPPHLKTQYSKHFRTKQFHLIPHKILVSHVHPGLVSPYSVGKLDVPGLQSDSLCMNRQQIGIFHQAHHVIFTCFMESLKSTLHPLHWALHILLTLILYV